VKEPRSVQERASQHHVQQPKEHRICCMAGVGGGENVLIRHAHAPCCFALPAAVKDPDKLLICHLSGFCGGVWDREWLHVW
jgi:hypothetical protein